MIHQFHPAARDELVETVTFYESARTGLGAQFRDAVRATLERVDKTPTIGRRTSDGYWRALVSGFPYDVVYRVRGEILDVLALAHHRRRPGYWRNRAQG